MCLIEKLKNFSDEARSFFSLSNQITFTLKDEHL